jgi:hypothetical protein
MSNSLAIGAVTATLRNLLQTGIAEEGGGIGVTTMPPERAVNFGQADGTARINLFLYNTQVNAAFRNMGMPGQTRPGETGQPPVPLDLFYILTAYERTDGDVSVIAHRLLGRAMSVLHDHPLLGANEIRSALPDNDLADQIERVRITPQPLSLDELSKLWMMFQTGYRISAAYQVSVVLIESWRPARAPLPVLARGREDGGVIAQADLIPPFPTITGVGLESPVPGELHSMRQRVSFELNDRIAILGHHFAGSGSDPASVMVTVRLSSPRLDEPRDTMVPVTDRTDQSIRFRIPNDSINLPAGSYMLSALVEPNGAPAETRTTNEWPVLIAPQITTTMPMTVARVSVVDEMGDATITLSCSPEVRPEQRVTLVLGDQQLRAEDHPTQTDTFSFRVQQIRAGDYRVRLRVDGVDSHLLDFSDPERPKFRDAFIITIT